MTTATSSDEITVTDGGKLVVIAVDRSKQAEHAFDWYVKYVHRPANHVVLVHVPEGATVKTSEGFHLPEGEWKKMAEKEKTETSELLHKFKAKVDANQVKATYKSIYGKPGEAVVEAAKLVKADLVVVGTRGMGSIRRTILGSVSDYIIHHAHVPVIVCRQ